MFTPRESVGLQTCYAVLILVSLKRMKTMTEKGSYVASIGLPAFSHNAWQEDPSNGKSWLHQGLKHWTEVSRAQQVSRG